MAKVTLFSSGGADWSAIWTGLLTLVEIWQVLELLGLAVFPAAHTGAKAGLGICQIPASARRSLHGAVRGFRSHSCQDF